ncbi:TetR/AcrR family transcriptional regulator [Paenibacillus xylanivorans]|uniref:TetR family transcriptional regulator n=1 Tax=Paenibacillus xylanivorans TaxID=1705561 RepID=A0A0M9BNJ5_9BACL|nr:helix-turn-helix domain-containing protein [Paenibacillus xylanivorans]KOY14932.1 TetR family transcriptional regulator [Paenibacillus xylanivorans]
MKKELTSMKQTRLNSILDEATKLLIEKPNASMNDIAESAKIGIATLHRYVESREQLMVYLGLRAIEVVSEAMQNIHLDEENCETYIPELIEVLIPLGDKIFFLTHDAAIHYNPEIEGADLKLREPILHAVSLLQQKNYFRQDVNKNWIVDVLYSILFLTWQQVVSGDIARKSAASLVVDTFYHGFRARS